MKTHPPSPPYPKPPRGLILDNLIVSYLNIQPPQVWYTKAVLAHQLWLPKGVVKQSLRRLVDGGRVEFALLPVPADGQASLLPVPTGGQQTKLRKHYRRPQWEKQS